MSLASWSSSEALRNLQSTPEGRWHKPDAEPDQVARQAASRIGQGFFLPPVEPAFRLRRTDKVFAIGSCFARGLEQGLLGRGMDVVSAAKEFDRFELSRPGVTRLGFTNKYTTAAIRNELTWALHPGAEYPDDAYVPLGDGNWVDLQTNPTLKYVDLERTRERRRLITEVTRRITDCRLVVITLGLVEGWRDTKTGLMTNMAPLPPMLRAEPDRFRFEVMEYDQCRADLEAIHRMLTSAGRPDLQIVVTVSPVPLNATFSGRDVVVANAHSKALLRTAAEEWATRHDDVHYFPSYEIATNSDPKLVWAEDLRHVQGRTTQTIIGWFLEHYLEPEPAPA